MTLARMLRMVGRQWLVLVIGVALTAVAAAASLQATGVYTARTTITLLPPDEWAAGGNSLAYGGGTLVGFARLIERTVDVGEGSQLFTDPNTRLYGAGVRQGELVYVPDSGGQWAPNLNSPTLIIDVVGPTDEYVSSRVAALTAEIDDAIDARQDEFKIAEDMRIGWEATPRQPEPTYVSPNSRRMLGGIALLGLGATGVLAFAVEKLRRRRRTAHVGGQ